MSPGGTGSHSCLPVIWGHGSTQKMNAVLENEISWQRESLRMEGEQQKLWRSATLEY